MVSKPNTRFNVFLSHSSVDKTWVAKLKDNLLHYGVSVWLDRDEIRPGDLFAEVLEGALDNCQAVALIVSPEALASGWVKQEYYRALSLAADKKSNLQLIPVILQDAALPGFLIGRNWVDFRDETAYEQNVWKLVWGITGQKPPQVLKVSRPGSNAPGRVRSSRQPHLQSPQTFIHSGPVPPSHFIGRELEADRILSQLVSPGRGSSAISGDPRVGKTSLLHYLCEPRVREGWGLSPSWCHFLYVDCQSIAPYDEAAFWRYVLRELEPHLSDDEALSGPVHWLLEQPGLDVFYLNSLFDKIARACRLVVLILDEFEEIVGNPDQQSQQSLELLFHLRALLNRPERGLALLVATRAPLEKVCAKFRRAGSPFHNSFSAIILHPFTEEEVEELFIRYQTVFSSAERIYLRQIAGTHPYLVQLAASLIVRARGKQVEVEIPRLQIEAKFEQEADGYFSDMFDYSSEPQQMLLTWLALSTLSRHLAARHAKLEDPHRVFRRYDQELAYLVKRGLVLDLTDGPTIFSPIFANWIMRRVIADRGAELLSCWRPYYAEVLPPAQAETLQNLVEAIIKWPVIVKTPELMSQLFAPPEEVSPSPNLSGELVLGRYVIEKPIGGGGMADIFRAYDPRLNRLVAVKRLRTALSEAEEFRTRFQREAQAVAMLRHPNIVQVYDFGVQDSRYCMVMEFIDGHDLREHLHNLRAAGQTLPWEEILRIAACVADALDYAHQRGMIHRDVKPANVLLTEDGGVFLTDFGLVRLLGQADLTESGGFVGTLAYMAPEQMTGRSQSIDHHVDIYALGCVIYEMFTGRLPFELADLPLAPLDKEPPAPSLVVPTLPEVAGQVILRALAKDAANRPPSASQFVEDLRRALIA
jgi:hypothetical protein